MAQDKKLLGKQSIGDRLRERRRSLEFTQRSLAKKVGLSPSAIGRLESEEDYVTSRPTIIALAQALNCDPDWLETGEGATFGPLIPPEVVKERDRRVKEFMNSLPVDVRTALTEPTLANVHYKGMESLLDRALKTRAPLPDPDDELDFNVMLREWARKRIKGRAAILKAIDALELIGKIELYKNRGAMSQGQGGETTDKQ